MQMQRMLPYLLVICTLQRFSTKHGNRHVTLPESYDDDVVRERSGMREAAGDWMDSASVEE